MSLELEAITGRETRRLSLAGERLTIGSAPQNDVALPDDSAVSRLHALLERFAAGWAVSDLGSSNGTWLNGKRIWSPRGVRYGDEIRVGQTRLIVRSAPGEIDRPTDAQTEAPAITARERDVLVALCRPLLARDMFTATAPTRAIAEELVVTQTAVKQHLVNLYDKFGIAASDSNRRERLANEALRRGAVSIHDLDMSAGE